MSLAHLLSNPDARFTDLGADWHARKNDRDRKTRRHLKELQALGYQVTFRSGGHGLFFPGLASLHRAGAGATGRQVPGRAGISC